MDATEARRRAEEVNRRYRQHRNVDRVRAAFRFALIPSLVATIPGSGIAFCLALQQMQSSPELAMTMLFGGAVVAATLVGCIGFAIGLTNEMQKPD